METDLPDVFSGLDINTPRWTTFHPFPRLPLELRLRIWRLTVPKPCIIFCGQTAPISSGVCYRHEEEGITDTFNAVVKACRESREEFLHAGQAVVNTETSSRGYVVCQFGPSMPNVLFSPDSDTLDVFPERILLPGEVLSTIAKRPVEGKKRIETSMAYVKHLSTSLDRFWNYFINDLTQGAQSNSIHEDVPRYFPSLETITFKIDSSKIPPSVRPGNPFADHLLQAIQRITKERVQRFTMSVESMFEDAGRKNPEWKVPLLRFRDEQDFLEDPMA